MLKIKICGITKINEIDYLNELKPDYIGFIFTTSKRQINKIEAKILSNVLIKEIKKVGVFRNNTIEEILDVIKEVSLDVVQLHGHENNEYIKALREVLKPDIEIWKALLIDKKTNLKNYPNNYIDNFILDGCTPGSGETFPWSNINNVENNIGFFLAGGINENNVLEGIKVTNPKGIDVSSGVEIINENGERIKSFKKMKKLINKVRNNNEGEI